MMYVLMYGCDTDTNCAIVGGLISCKNSVEIPKEYMTKIENSQFNRFYRRRGHRWLMPYYTLFERDIMM
jgi:hypothetical protein